MIIGAIITIPLSKGIPLSHAASSASQPSWSIVPTPDLGSTGGQETGFNAVTTFSSMGVWAVGSNHSSNNSLYAQSLIEHWNGTNWMQQTSPNPGTFENILNGVKALSATDIWAVGYYRYTDATNNSAYHSLIVHTTDGGVTWSQEASASDPNYNVNSFRGIALGSTPSNTWAVGESYENFTGLTDSKPLVEQYSSSTPNFSDRLFVLLQGINTSYFGIGVPSDFASLVATLQQNFPGAHYHYYSYPHTPIDLEHPQQYSCQDTFQDDIRDDVSALSLQIQAEIASHPEIHEVDIAGAHSLGGLIALAYVVAVVEHVGLIANLPDGVKLHVVTTEDSPLGGITASIAANIITKIMAGICSGNPLPDMKAVNQLKKLYATAKDHNAQGASASIVKAIFGGKYVSNQDVATAAAKQGIIIFSEANSNDPVYVSPCPSVPDNFPTTQAVGSYGFLFASDVASCTTDSISQIHKAVLSSQSALQAIVQVLQS